MLSVCRPPQSRRVMVSLCRVAAARQPVFFKSLQPALAMLGFSSQASLQSFNSKRTQLSFS
jgi:hypothetical protein